MVVPRAAFWAIVGLELSAAAVLTAYLRGRQGPPAAPYVRPAAPFVRASDVGRPISDSVRGVTMFRGNSTRTFYGTGPVPRAPRILWRYPRGRPMCAISRVGRESPLWCGNGWTGQASVVEREDGVEVIVGAYDRAIHFIDGATGRARRPPFETGDIIKGSVTLDPDGYPLVYSGSRDNHYRIIALDRERPVELWRLSASDAPRPMWNDDWDGNGVVIEDYLFEGGENGWFYVVKLNRGYGADGRVTVAPEILARIPSFDDQLLRDIGDHEVSIENSPAVFGWRAYFANSAGAVWGVDLRGLRTDAASVRPVFRYWTGDDTDASIVVDEEGFLYVASELQRFNRRSAAVGQLQKLDPRRPDAPRVWGLAVPRGGGERQGGIWSTPALFGRTLFVTTNSGRLLAVDRDRGTVRWERRLAPHAWSSPVVVDSTLIVADCEGALRAFDVRTVDRAPPQLWEFRLPGGPCIEATPVVWNGVIYVGARDGYIYAIGDGPVR